MNKATFDAMVAQYAVQEASGEGVASWDGGVRCVLPEVIVGGKAVQDGTPTPDVPVMPEFSAGTTVQCGDTVAVAPELLAIPGTEYRDEWDAQTGKGVRRIYELKLSNTGYWGYGDGYFGCPLMYLRAPEADKALRAHSFSSHFKYSVMAQKDCFWIDGSGTGLRVQINGVNTVKDLVSFLEEQNAAGTPVTVWYALAEPVEFQTDPQPLIAPKGTGHIMQVRGTLDAVPISAKYVTHS